MDLTVSTLDDDTAEITDHEYQVKNSCSPAHVEMHSELLRVNTIVGANSGADVVADLGTLFPNVQFCAEAVTQLGNFQTGDPGLQLVLRHLESLNGQAGEWNRDGQFNYSGLPDCSHESGPTLDKYGSTRDFTCPDGIRRRFSWHTKLKAINKRIHFYVDSDIHAVFIGYIGDHLRTVKYGT